MGKIRAVSVLQNKILNDSESANTTLDNKFAAASLMSKTGWSSAVGPKNSLPTAISVGDYVAGRLHCGFRGVYESPATAVNIAAHRKWEVINADISFKRYDQIGRCEFVEVFNASPAELSRIGLLIYNVFATFGNFTVFGGTALEFFIGSDHADKAGLESALDGVSTTWDTLTAEARTFYETVLGFNEATWNASAGSVWKCILNLLCGGDGNLIKWQPLAPPS